jgi:hypothetical protein
MPDPIVIELQRMASEGRCPVDDLLRKALIVATKLQIADFSDWIRAELDGYYDNDVPKYRIVSTSVKAINPLNGRHMPIFSDGPGRGDEFSRQKMGMPVGKINALLASDSTFFQISLPDSVQRRLHIECDMPAPLECYIHVSRNSLSGILDAVRNTILNWALKLEQEGILGEGMSFTSEEKAKAMTKQNIHIGSFQGILGDVAGSTVTQTPNMSIKAGDFNSLKQTFAEAGISPADIESLKDSLDTDPKPTSSSGYGPKVSAWIGTMVTKAASGAWKVTLDTAGKLISTAIAAYYGLKG